MSPQDPNSALAAFLTSALSEVCFGAEADFPLEATVDRYFTPDYVQRVNGEVLDRATFVAHIRHLRAAAARGVVRVLEVVQEGRRFADRHEVHAIKADGGEMRAEVYLFGERDEDGRIRRVDEVTRLLQGAPEDAALGQAR